MLLELMLGFELMTLSHVWSSAPRLTAQAQPGAIHWIWRVSFPLAERSSLPSFSISESFQLLRECFWKVRFLQKGPRCLALQEDIPVCRP